ncbi:MAG: GAF domain-containing protein [Fimbriimonadaceae bacterium]|nr:MAG: GAF domain-containing protein [Fimbriimonadaceae bacterium]
MKHKLARRDLADEMIQPLLKAVLEESEHGVLVTDLQHRSLVCNARFGEIWDIDINRVVSTDVEDVRQQVRDRIINEDKWEANLAEVYSDPHAVQSDEIRLVKPNKTIRRYTGPVYLEDGTPVGRLWTFLDITREAKRRRQLEAIHSAAMLVDPDPVKVYQSLVDQVAGHFDSFALLSIRKGDFMEFRAVGPESNPAKQVSGNKLSDSFCQFCLSMDRPIIIQDATRDLRMDSLLPARSGLTRYAGVPVRHSSGRTIGTLCILDARSEEKLDQDDLQFLAQIASRIAGELEREEYLKSLESDLEVTQDTLANTQEKLIQSEKLAVTGALSASVAHDIRNILASTRLQLDVGQGDVAAKMAMMATQLDRFEVLAHRLLSYSRPTRSSMSTVDINEIVLNVITLLEAQANIQQVKLETNLQADDHWVEGDEGRLEHLLVNLILNGIQAMPEGGTVLVSCFDHSAGLEVQVSDQGVGIEQEMLDQIFEPFVSHRANGYGLGLFSCREIARAHNAELICESEPGKGTTFSIQFKR